MKEHPQAELLRAIADGKQMQWQSLTGQWCDFSEHDSQPLKLIVNGVLAVRIKPATILVNGIEVPEPMRVAPKEGARIFVPDISRDGYHFEVTYWHAAHAQILFRGICHTTEAAAVAHAKAMLAPSMKGGE